MSPKPLPKQSGHRPRPAFAGLLTGAALALAFAGLAPPAQAQTIVAPGVTESAASSGLTTPFNSAARTYMGYLDASDFSSLTTPVYITGIQFRLATGFNSEITTATWPPQALTFSEYNIQLAQASAADVAAGDLEDGSSFANNQNAATAVTVRSGALTIAANSFSNSLSGVNSFGPTVSFTTPYLFTPGSSLTYLIDESGYGSSSTASQAAFASTDFAAGVADALVSTAGADAASPTGYTQPLIVQFQYSAAAPVPETSTAASLGLMLALGLGVAAVRRRYARKQGV